MANATNYSRAGRNGLGEPDVVAVSVREDQCRHVALPGMIAFAWASDRARGGGGHFDVGVARARRVRSRRRHIASAAGGGYAHGPRGEMRYRTVREDLIEAVPELREPYQRLFEGWDQFKGATGPVPRL